MTTTTTQNPSPSIIDDILAAQGASPVASAPGAELPLALRKTAESAAQRAYYRSMAEHQDRDRAAKDAKEAFAAALAPAPSAAPALPAFVAELDAPAPVSPRFAPALGAHPALCGCEDCEAALPAVLTIPIAPLPVVVVPEVAAGALDGVGAARSARDFADLQRSGFAPRTPLYQRGSRVNETGVENATSARAQFDAMPAMVDAAGEFITRIQSERRRHVDITAHDLAFDIAGEMRWPGREAGIVLTETAFKGLCSRRGHAGADYLKRCPASLRAHNLNTWSDILRTESERAREHAAEEAAKSGKRSDFEPARLRLRVRDQVASPTSSGAAARTGEEVFSVVSPGYAAFDVDRIADALRLSLDARSGEAVNLTIDGRPVGADTLRNAKGTITYDGERARFEVLFHSDVRPAHYVAGEFFRAGVVVTTDDTGGGSIVVRSVVWQNLCLNLIIIDECSIPVARLVHAGDVRKLARKFRGAIAKGLGNISTFIKRWGYACEENLAEGARALAPEGTTIPARPAEQVAGIFRGLIESERFTSYPGRSTDKIVDALVACWEKDDSGATLNHMGVTRAAICNAITRFAHEVLPTLTDDPWMADEAQREAGALLWGVRKGQSPAPMAWLPEADSAAPAAAVA